MLVIKVSADSYIAFVERFPEHLSDAKQLGSDVKVSGVDKVVVAGVGGSGIAGSMLKVYCSEKAPALHVHVSKCYEVPSFVDSKTLVFVISYSGNTEETIDAFNSAVRRNYPVAAISVGGKMLHLASVFKIMDFPLNI